MVAEPAQAVPEAATHCRRPPQTARRGATRPASWRCDGRRPEQSVAVEFKDFVTRHRRRPLSGRSNAVDRKNQETFSNKPIRYVVTPTTPSTMGGIRTYVAKARRLSGRAATRVLHNSSYLAAAARATLLPDRLSPLPAFAPTGPVRKEHAQGTFRTNYARSTDGKNDPSAFTCEQSIPRTMLNGDLPRG